MYEAKHISVSIARRPEEVYAFASNPENLPKWADGLSRSTVIKSGDEWICESPMGRVRVKFAARNSFGIMDHEVSLPTGEWNYNPFRVFANDSGSEVVFTLFRLPRMDDKGFESDAKHVESELRHLKVILESDERN